MARAICEVEPERPSTALLPTQLRKTPADSPSQKRNIQVPSEEQFASLRKRGKLLQGDLDNIVLKALRKEPERRYTSVEKFSEDIDRFLENLPVHARKESLPYRARKFLKRNRVPTIAAALGAVIVLALVAGVRAVLENIQS